MKIFASIVALFLFIWLVSIFPWVLLIMALGGLFAYIGSD
jgi:hypothetical protein